MICVFHCLERGATGIFDITIRDLNCVKKKLNQNQSTEWLLTAQMLGLMNPGAGSELSVATDTLEHATNNSDSLFNSIVASSFAVKFDSSRFASKELLKTCLSDGTKKTSTPESETEER